MAYTPTQKATVEKIVVARSSHPALFSPDAAEKPPLCWTSVETYRELVAQTLQADGPWNETRDAILVLLENWLRANKDVKQIKVGPKSGRFRTFCGNLVALQGNFSDLLRSLCEKAGVSCRTSHKS
jgi:hypothetical protein